MMPRAMVEAVVYRGGNLWSIASPTRRLPCGMVTDPHALGFPNRSSFDVQESPTTQVS
jgi:hypothetical protein